MDREVTYSRDWKTPWNSQARLDPYLAEQPRVTLQARHNLACIKGRKNDRKVFTNPSLHLTLSLHLSPLPPPFPLSLLPSLRLSLLLSFILCSFSSLSYELYLRSTPSPPPSESLRPPLSIYISLLFASVSTGNKRTLRRTSIKTDFQPQLQARRVSI